MRGGFDSLRPHQVYPNPNRYPPMKSLRLIPVIALGLILGFAVSRAEEAKHEGVHAKCCAKAEKNGEACKHECCVAAAKDHKNCEKCGGTNEVKK